MSLSTTATTASVTGDPVVARREYLASVDRTIGVLDAALADYTILRDEAPTPEVAAGFSLVIDEFTAARASFVMGRETVAASDPLTVAAYRSGVDSVGDGTRNLALAATLVQQIELPHAYTAASAVAPSGRYLTEVNVTSPTGVREIDALAGTRMSHTVIAWVERRAAGRGG